MLTFLAAYTTLLSLGKQFFLEKLFVALLISYMASILFLKSKNKISFLLLKYKKVDQPFPYTSFLKFGTPLVLWYLFAGIIPYTDKLLIAKKFGHEVQGNYQALFDLMYRSVGVLFGPVLMATFPYLSQSYKDGNISKILTLIKKTVMIEAAIMLGCLIIYFLGGSILVLKLLNIKNSPDYYWAGALILSVAFIWQMAMMLHKPFELMKKTQILLYNNFLALIATMVPLSIIYYYNFGFIAYPIGILCGAVCYAALCVFQVKSAIRKGTFL